MPNPFVDRKHARLDKLHYSTIGAYFVTICIAERRCVLGTVEANWVNLSPLGALVAERTVAIPDHHQGWTVDTSIVMPNHVHSVLWHHKDEQVAKTSGPGSNSLAAVVGSFKSGVSRMARAAGLLNDDAFWQRGYFDHIIRDEQALEFIRAYILNNPLQWALDEFNAQSKGKDAIYEWIEEQRLKLRGGLQF